MGLGLKRICQQCSSKFYDLEKDPILCPKCGSTFDPEALNKPKRGRRKAAVEEESSEIEVSLDDEAIEEADVDEDAVEEDEEQLNDLEMEGEEESHKEKGKSIDDLDSDADDIIESDVEDKD